MTRRLLSISHGLYIPFYYLLKDWILPEPNSNIFDLRRPWCLGIEYFLTRNCQKLALVRLELKICSRVPYFLGRQVCDGPQHISKQKRLDLLRSKGHLARSKSNAIFCPPIHCQGCLRAIELQFCGDQVCHDHYRHNQDHVRILVLWSYMGLLVILFYQ